MSRLASVRFPDGELPEVMDVVRLADHLLRRRAGDDGAPALRGNAVPLRAARPSPTELRSDPDAIPNFVEECLRLEGPIKGSFRLRPARYEPRRRRTSRRGPIVMAVIGAANRDPRVFEDPDRFDREARERPAQRRLRSRRALLSRRQSRPRRGAHQLRAAPRAARRLAAGGPGRALLRRDLHHPRPERRALALPASLVARSCGFRPQKEAHIPSRRASARTAADDHLRHPRDAARRVVVAACPSSGANAARTSRRRPKGRTGSATASASRRAAARRRATSPRTTTASGPASRRRDSRTWTATACARQVVYGPTCTQLQINDAALHEQVARVYNDWAAEFQRDAPDRLILLPDIPPYDPQVARAELERCAKLGHKGAIVSSTVGRGKPLFDDEWTAFWDAAQEIGIPIHAHLVGRPAQPDDEARLLAHARRRRRGPDAARRDARGIDLLGHPREAPARQVRDGRGGPRLDPVRDRAARPRAAQVRLEDHATTRSACCRARSSRGRCSPPTRTRSSASS